MGFSRQESWSGLPYPYPGDLPDPGIKPASPAAAGGLFPAKPLGSPAPVMSRTSSTAVCPEKFTDFDD